MKRLFSLSLLVLMAIMAWAEKVQVSVTMNARSRTMTLTPKAGGEAIETGEPTSNKYTFEAEPGVYVLEGFNGNGSSNGTIEVELNDGTELSVFTVWASATNKTDGTAWSVGEDYTLDVQVAGRDGSQRVITLGTDGTNNTFLVQSGDTYHAWFKPSEAHEAEGYLVAYKTATVTFNATGNMAIPMGYTCTVTAPKDASFFLGTKSAHYVPFTAVEPKSVSEAGDNKVYTYLLAEKAVYNYRVSAEGKLTTAAVFTMPSEAKTLEIAAEELAGDPKVIDRDPQSNSKYNVADLFTNAAANGCVAMNSGEEYQLVTLRTWEIVDGITNNYFIEPDYHYTVIDLDGQPATDVVEVSAQGVITAKKAGTAIVLVTYDAINTPGQVGGPLFGAIWPENTGVVVVTVDAADAGITPNMTINADLNSTNDHKQAGANVDAEMDVIYFLGDAASYTFTPEGATAVEVAQPVLGANAASYNGFTAVEANADGSYTLPLTEGRNIVRLTSAAGSVYQVVRAKKCAYTVANATRPDEAIMPGDQATVTISGLYHPAHKLAGVYNMSASIQYNDAEGNVLASKANQYQFAATDAARTVTVTIPEDCDKPYVLTGGVLKSSGWGDPYGGHRSINYTIGKNPNFTAVQHTSYFGALPDIVVYEPAPAEAEYDLAVLTFEDADYKGEGNMLGNNDWSSLIDSPQYGGTLLYGESGMGYDEGEGNYWWYDENNTGLYSELNERYGRACYWGGGAAISNYVTDDYTTGGYATQLTAYSTTGKGGHNGSENFLVCFGYNDNSMYAEDTRPILTFADGEAKVIDHLYLSLNAYTLNSLVKGDGFSAAAKPGDWVNVTFEGCDAEGNSLGLVTVPVLDDSANPLMGYTKVDLASLGAIVTLRINMESNLDNGYGLSVPAYCIVDDIAVRVPKAVEPEPETGVATFEDLALESESYWTGDPDGEEAIYGYATYSTFKSGNYVFDNYYMEDFDSWMGYAYSNQTSTEYSSLADQYKSCVGSGVNGSDNYVVAYPDASVWGVKNYIRVEGEPRVVPGFYITNSAYTLHSMTHGDAYAGDPFAVGDYYKITIHAVDADDNEIATRDFCLADYRFENEADRYMVTDWQYVDLSQLGEASGFYFSFDGSRKSGRFMNTLTYFCIDDFGAEGTEDVRDEGNYNGPGTGIASVNGESAPATIYNISGQRVNNTARPGIYIMNGRKVVIK